MRSSINLLVMILMLSFSVKAERHNDVAKVYYSGNMTVKMVSNLIEAIDDINTKDNVRKIYIYINSYGGDMDAGLMASSSIQSSRIPVTTVAMSTVGSSATLMLCAAKERKSLPDGSIYLHPSFIEYNGDVRPSDIQALSKESNRFNKMFHRAYEKCTNISNEKIDEILYSESNRLTFTPDEAIKIGLISSIEDKIIDSALVYYITDN
ncbi:ATP-dependent Clp protease proteolytic subunit [Yersinia ruckeri]|uniref:ATP-dependent Clp protease proteolytic subunit n=1 Tax=Yersinia aldovae TaxID=29483 RepID=A0ABM9SYM4_YERAL|nr:MULTISPECIES: ATP-dependent Clp protease proteolytic subunit [Yersinia]MCW6556837.1 ATP-dependent Clp protease proteolytic subunit [Yersinia ruckeri]UZX73917.1 ATP-dependent Clp protease proteolytic subunit [Yersinia ruckeri]CNL82204.1 ATP-dependent Clp protease proteolytic subunit [Yersinia aldovae]